MGAGRTVQGRRLSMHRIGRRIESRHPPGRMPCPRTGGKRGRWLAYSAPDGYPRRSRSCPQAVAYSTMVAFSITISSTGTSWWKPLLPVLTVLRLSTTSVRSVEHPSELQSLMRISYAVFCSLKQNDEVV